MLFHKAIFRYLQRLSAKSSKALERDPLPHKEVGTLAMEEQMECIDDVTEVRAAPCCSISHAEPCILFP